jgi:hypothetical protein
MTSDADRAANLRKIAERYETSAIEMRKRADLISPPLRVYSVAMEVSADVVIHVRAADADTARQVAASAAAEGLYAIDMGVEMWLDGDDAQELAEAQGAKGNWLISEHTANDERVKVLLVTEVTRD